MMAPVLSVIVLQARVVMSITAACVATAARRLPAPASLQLVTEAATAVLEAAPCAAMRSAAADVPAPASSTKPATVGRGSKGEHDKLFRKVTMATPSGDDPANNGNNNRITPNGKKGTEAVNHPSVPAAWKHPSHARYRTKAPRPVRKRLGLNCLRPLFSLFSSPPTGLSL